MANKKEASVTAWTFDPTLPSTGDVIIQGKDGSAVGLSVDKGTLNVYSKSESSDRHPAYTLGEKARLALEVVSEYIDGSHTETRELKVEGARETASGYEVVFSILPYKAGGRMYKVASFGQWGDLQSVLPYFTDKH